MCKFKKGDIICVKHTPTDNYKYFAVGHKGVIIGDRQNDPILIDFNNQDNSFIFGDGYWYVYGTDVELEEG